MFAEVIVDVLSSEVDKVFDYKIPESLLLQTGERVVVPFGNRVIEGYVINIKQKSKVAPEKLKSIIKSKDNFPTILPEMLELMKYMVKKYDIKLVDALRLFIVSEFRAGKIKTLTQKICYLNQNVDLEAYSKTLRKNSFNQFELLTYLKTHPSENQAILNEKFSASAVNKFKKDNILCVKTIDVNRSPSTMEVEDKAVALTAEQNRAINAIKNFENKTYLLHGVTGSGKTEVYMRLIKKVLQMEKTAILLVPEISLTPQVLGNLKARFGATVAVLHSGLSAGEKYDEWKRILNCNAKVVVGARSAIFAPLKNLGIIIIDEEHESSYNSESNPRYKTFDIAKFRQTYNKCPLVLGSATPSVETYYKTQTKEIELLELPIRVNQKEMPKIQIVDMLSEIHNGNGSIFSNQLINDLQECFAQKKQALLFLNRRGFTSFMRCNECGYIAKCTDCDAPLVYHKDEEKLKCHYCGKRFKALTACPECKSTYIRQGAVGTQKVVSDIQEIFPNIKIFRMDNDTTRNKNGHQTILEEFAKHKPAILVGTQMIAKGHDFSEVGVVGIIDADQSLYQTDYKSTEKTFQLITQVSGRAGRKDGGGKIVLQTYNPKHYVYKFASNYNYKGFFEKEINIRETTNFPPFSTILRVLITYENESFVSELTKEIFALIKQIAKNFSKDFLFLEAMKSPHTKIKNKFRYQILLRFTKTNESDIIEQIYNIVNKFKNKKASVFVEIDPQNLG